MNLSDKEIKNLSTLFLSKDDSNTELAFEIMVLIPYFRKKLHNRGVVVHMNMVHIYNCFSLPSSVFYEWVHWIIAYQDVERCIMKVMNSIIS